MEDCAAVPNTGNTPTEPGPQIAAVRHIPTPAERRKGGIRGGRRPKQSVALTGLGVIPAPVLDVSSSDGRMAVLQAVVAAIVEGRCSQATALALTTVVREARFEAESNWERIANQLAQKLDALPGHWA